MSTSISGSTATSSTTNASAGTASGGVQSWFRGLRFWVILLSVLGVSLILFVVIRVQGRVAGVEFSPSHFQERQFEFFEIPWIHLQVTPIDRSSSTSAAATYIRQNGLISVPQGQPVDWHLVSITRGLTGSTPADAQLLTNQLAIDTGSNFWSQWSTEHPQPAKILWPIVQRTASRELYVLLPRLFELAHQLTESADFAQSINAHLRVQYANLVRESRAAGQRELGDELLAEALTDYPDDPQLLALRSETDPLQAVPSVNGRAR